MKVLSVRFLTIYFSLFVHFIGCSIVTDNVSKQSSQFTGKIAKTDVYAEIERCIFLEKQFLPQKQSLTIFKKFFKISIQAGASIATGLFLTKILNSYFLLRQKNENRQKFSTIVFLTSTTIMFFILKYLTTPKEPTTLERLKNFIQSWPSRKNNISEKFWEKFENIHSLYQKNKNLPLSEDEAERFVKKILMEAIDYKIYLQYKQSNF
jgi:hypothetical protein